MPLRSASQLFSLQRLVTQLLSLFEPPKRQPQAADVHFYTAGTLVNGASARVETLRTELSALWDLRAPPCADTEAVRVTGPGTSRTGQRKTRIALMRRFSSEEDPHPPQEGLERG